MRRRIMALLMAVMMLVISAAPAMAQNDRPKRTPPVRPPGLGQSGVDRPEQAPTPLTGPLNQFKRFE